MQKAVRTGGLVGVYNPAVDINHIKLIEFC